MILDGNELGVTKEAMRKYAEPKLLMGQIFTLKFSDTSVGLPGCKKMKKGRYIVVSVHPTPFTKVKGLWSYDIMCFRKGAKYIWGMATTVIDQAIDIGLARVD